jgi:hypothetical protein
VPEIPLQTILYKVPQMKDKNQPGASGHKWAGWRPDESGRSPEGTPKAMRKK